ncbi:hypothetical protein JNUCC1_03364 [Lentibacillus sp. JNUCC-1]|uniref:hypothetical protein n=1 Tax=Lentibacillus sp. JNUCC-1 TaxID=2654513 RepID=UPI0012E89468|nr:hypothetical protein [Lentibacillus sp. JNUCC-1]MUV39486.1 hypothetical protein [Lentibacillus sp. JNUCC-1]
MMTINITSVNVRYAEGAADSVQVHFSAYDDQRTINVNGYIPLTAAEYEGNESLSALEGLVRQEVSSKIKAA